MPAGNGMPSQSRSERPLTSAEREMQEVLAAARVLGIEREESEAPVDPDSVVVQVAAELGLDQPVVVKEPTVPAFMMGEEAEAEADVISVQEENAAWYAVNTYSGHEKKVHEALNRRIRNMDAEHEFVARSPDMKQCETLLKGNKPCVAPCYVLVPTQKQVVIRGGKRQTVNRTLLPGYVLLQVRVDPETRKMSDNSWYLVTGTTGVTGFIGSQDQARPLPVEQVEALIGQMKVDEPRVLVGFEVDDSVRVTDGPFADFIAQVDQINIEKGKVRVLISMFGRETPVELDFDQVEKQ